MLLMRYFLAAILFLLCAPLFAANPTLTLADGRTIELSETVLHPLPTSTLQATAHGKTTTYAGYDLGVILKAVGAEPMESLEGKSLAKFMTVSAADGYRVVFSLSELDTTLGNHKVMLVNRENGKPLPPSDGPWRLVVPSDTRPARWVRQVIAIVIASP